MDFALAGTAAAMAATLCNPLEVVKIRMQLQGELQAKGNYKIHYKNVFHALYTIGAKDGLFALQKGLIPFACYQFTVSSTRLGIFQVLKDRGWTRNVDGTTHHGKTMGLAIFSGAIGGFVCSPFFLVKTHLQSKANEASIAVGHQHEHSGMANAFSSIYKENGIRGLFRGATSNIPRIVAASVAQLSSFEVVNEYMQKKMPGHVWIPLCTASAVAGFFITVLMAPFDLISTRFYNQPADKSGKGLVYKNVVDCAAQMYKAEGVRGFFKGWTACYFRMGPYSMLILVFWDRLKDLHSRFSQGDSRLITATAHKADKM